jgi:hypothetical protein
MGGFLHYSSQKIWRQSISIPKKKNENLVTIPLHLQQHCRQIKQNNTIYQYHTLNQLNPSESRNNYAFGLILTDEHDAVDT